MCTVRAHGIYCADHGYVCNLLQLTLTLTPNTNPKRNCEQFVTNTNPNRNLDKKLTTHLNPIMTGVCKSTYGRGVVGRGSEWSLPHPRACN